MNPAQVILGGLLRFYQRAISPVLTTVFGPLGFGCRFDPTCSQYALEAIRQHGAWRGVLLASRRLLRCHPWGGCGHDPVPPTRSSDRLKPTRSDPPARHFVGTR